MGDVLRTLFIAVLVGGVAPWLLCFLLYDVLDITGFKARQRAVMRAFDRHDEDADDGKLIARLRSIQRRDGQ